MTEQTPDAYPFVPSPDTVEVTMTYNVLGITAVNVFHVHNGAHIDNMDAFAGNVLDAFQAWETNEAKPLRSTYTTLTKISVRDLGEEHGRVWERVVGITGTNAQATVAPVLTFSIKWNTGRGGRSYRGRTYWIGLTTDKLNGTMQIQQVAADALVAACNKLIQRINGTNTALVGFFFPTTDARLVVLSRMQNGVWLNPAVVTPITSASYADLNLDIQRRRMIGRGK